MEGAPSGLIEQNITSHLLNEKVLAGDECRARNDRQTYFSLARELVTAQFVLADHELTRRLWQEVSDRNLDMGRISTFSTAAAAMKMRTKWLRWTTPFCN